MKTKFLNLRFSPEKLAKVAQADGIIQQYLAQGLRLTLRQLYYQHVVANLITNEEKSYKNLGKLLSDARLAGLIDWDAIEDRVRVPRLPTEFDSLEDLIDAAFRSFRLPRWEGQDNYAELWVEKDALSSVLAPLARQFHVTLMVNRGYSSQSAMHEAGIRFVTKEKQGFTPILFYLGDHDPSGEDMVRDVQDRLNTFGSNVVVMKLGLTMAQVRQYNPPPNPAKVTDSRAAEYIAKHGAQSWEVDALPPNVLQQIIRSAFSKIVDKAKMDAVIAKEDSEKALLNKALVNLRMKQGKP